MYPENLEGNLFLFFLFTVEAFYVFFLLSS